MKRVNMHEMVPGMILGSAVRDQKGRFLIPAGETVTEHHVRVCKIWGATNIWVKTDDEDENAQNEISPDIPDHFYLKAEEQLRLVFARNDLTTPFVSEVFRIAVQKKAREIHAGLQSGNKHFPVDKARAEEDYPYMPGRSSPLTIQSLINERLKLPTLPDIYHKTLESIHNVDVSIADIARIISNDPALSARVLQLVNSSFYGLLKKVETLTHALALIGTNQLMTIVTGVSAVSVFKNLSSSLLSMQQFWGHSVACGIVCRQLASFMDGVVNSERYFVSGLLHDIGRLALIQSAPAEMSRILAKARTHRIAMVEAEKQVLGFDHTHVGEFLAHSWNLPVHLETMIRYHHEPEGSKNARDPAVVAVADFLVTALNIGFSGNSELAHFSPEIWDKLDLSEGILENLVFQLDNQLNDTFVLIFGLE